MKYGILIFIVILALGCEIQDTIGIPDHYRTYDSYKGCNCNVYKMEFLSGTTLFRFALSGSCKELTENEYLQEYEDYLTAYMQRWDGRNGIVYLEFYDDFSRDQLNKRLIQSTECITLRRSKFNIMELNGGHRLEISI